MSVTSPPQALPTTQAVQVRPPGNVSQISAVVLQNHSPYTLTVTYGPNQYSLAPWTADLYIPAGTGVTVNVAAANPTSQIANNPTVIAVWYLPGEAPAGNAYPYSMSPVSATSESGDATLHYPSNLLPVTVTVIPDGMLSGAISIQAIITLTSFNPVAGTPGWAYEAWTLDLTDKFTGIKTNVIASGAWTATGSGNTVGDKLTGAGTANPSPTGYVLTATMTPTGHFDAYFDVSAVAFR